MKKLLSAALSFSVFALPAMAGQGSLNLSEAAADPLLESGLENLYSLDFTETQKDAREFVRRHPQNPLGPLFIAGTLWWQATADLPGAGIDQNVIAAFHASVDATVEISKPLFKSEDISARSDGYFAAGMALGLQGQMRLTQGQYIRAYRSGKKAMKFLKKCVKTDPRYYDAYFGLGVFDYQVAVLPGAVRMGAKMLLKGTGNAERGLQRIRLSIDKGLFASRQAAGFLLTLYVLNEKDYLKASDLAAKLRKDFPESSYFHFIETLLLHYQGKDVESYNSGKELFDRMRLAPAKFRKKQAGTLCGLFGDACYSEENLERAVKWLSMAVVAAGDDQKNKEWSAYLYFMRGLAFSLLGNAKSARIDYNRASKLPDFAGTHAWARHCAKQGCAEKDARLYLAGGSPKR